MQRELTKNIRFVNVEDSNESKAMLSIYSPSIVHTHASFEIEVPSLSDFHSRVLEYTKKYPWLVYESEGEILGYAYASAHRSRCAYDWSVESSVYVSASAQRKGIASSLYKTLFEILKAQGVVNVLAGIGLPNEASVAFHESFAFKKVAHYTNIGFKLGKWWDVGWWQLELQLPVRPTAVKSYLTF